MMKRSLILDRAKILYDETVPNSRPYINLDQVNVLYGETVPYSRPYINLDQVNILYGETVPNSLHQFRPGQCSIW